MDNELNEWTFGSYKRYYVRVVQKSKYYDLSIQPLQFLKMG